MKWNFKGIFFQVVISLVHIKSFREDSWKHPGKKPGCKGFSMEKVHEY